jgi:hypothetical protein
MEKNKQSSMIHAEELRPGNRVFWKPGFASANVLIQVEITAVLQDKAGYIRSHLEHRVEAFEDDLISKENPFASFEELEAIPLSDHFLQKITGIPYPSWIQSVHELQNWYYWQHEKKELQIND